MTEAVSYTHLDVYKRQIVAATKEAFAEMEAEKKNASPTLSELLRDYMNPVSYTHLGGL